MRDRYRKKQITYRYYVKSIVGLSLYNLSNLVVKSMTATSLVLYIFVFNNSSRIYFFADMKSSKDVNIASTPRKQLKVLRSLMQNEYVNGLMNYSISIEPLLVMMILST